MADILNRLRNNFPNNYNKSSKIFQRLIANESKTGAIQYEIEDIIKYMSEWINTPNMYQQSGDILKKTTAFFSYLESFTDESEKSYKNRLAAIFKRNGDSSWGTPYDVKQVFRQYFSTAKIYLAENTNDISENLLEDGDFSGTSTAWNFENCKLDKEARFSKAYGVTLNSNSVLSTTSDVETSHNEDSTYFLHFFLKGKCKVELINPDGEYWNSSSHAWQSDETYTEFSKSDWDNCSFYFTLLSTQNNVTIKIIGVEEKTYVDYFRLYKKAIYGSFTVIAHYEGSTAENSLALAGGNSDPNNDSTEENIPARYNNYGYFDDSKHNKTFISGANSGFAQDVYKDLLNYLRAVGVKAYLNIVTKDIN